MHKKKILEIACFNLSSAIKAAAAGADRIEFCANYWEGGITPLQRDILEAREKINVPIHVIIRPRGGDFNYSDAEFDEMEHAVHFCKEHKINGVVIGILTENFEVDLQACQKLVVLARPMSVTFHRAIDHCYQEDKAFEDLISLGIDRVLTSGGKSNAHDGIAEIKRLQHLYGDKIIIMPGGGIRSGNIQQVMHTGCQEFHSSGLTDNSVTVDAAEIKKLKKLLSL